MGPHFVYISSGIKNHTLEVMVFATGASFKPSSVHLDVPNPHVKQSVLNLDFRIGSDLAIIVKSIRRQSPASPELERMTHPPKVQSRLKLDQPRTGVRLFIKHKKMGGKMPKEKKPVEDTTQPSP